MNRDLYIRELTPAIARKLVWASRATNMVLDPVISERAQEGMIETNDLPCQEAPEIIDTCQFISDYEHRCVIPFDFDEHLVRRAIAMMIPKDRRVLILDEPVKWKSLIREPIVPYSELSTARIQFLSLSGATPKDLIEARDRYVVARVTLHNYGFEWLGKLFRNMIIYTPMEKQFSLNFGGDQIGQSPPLHSAAILYPAVVSALVRDKRTNPRGQSAYPLAGIHTKFLKSKFRLRDQIKESAGQVEAEDIE